MDELLPKSFPEKYWNWTEWVGRFLIFRIWHFSGLTSSNQKTETKKNGLEIIDLGNILFLGKMAAYLNVIFYIIQYSTKCIWYYPPYKVQKCKHDYMTECRWHWAIVCEGLLSVPTQWPTEPVPSVS